MGRALRRTHWMCLNGAYTSFAYSGVVADRSLTFRADLLGKGSLLVLPACRPYLRSRWDRDFPDLPRRRIPTTEQPQKRGTQRKVQ